ncbi:MAG: glutamine--tRNA ligase/YqeY domain fusion protein [Candidatus Omnitrophica bacterium]|nr:glutamine--tRNA ligase/YqeY domain fusion protein [Candidatus Omnitrophota bacterium]MCB9721549.1 glutamine--tRNA ligase/YqeY domain fusion protein [Candidatus Omnitrophota bacterium]
MNEPNVSEPKKESVDFIRQQISADVKKGKHDGRVVTRFPPEPNGFLHIGHAKSICLNFGAALEFSGRCHLRFDDTNPCKEETKYAEAIEDNVKWLGFSWGDHLYYASDYYQKLYEYAVDLITRGLAYVDDQSQEEIRANRGTLTEPGTNSPFRDRSVEENLALFEKMKNGDFEEGRCVLRAKIDMASPTIAMRDPAIYRIIKRVQHHRTGDRWCIYPMYDFAHCLSDAIEGITHSLCTLEFVNHRPLYDWFLEKLEVPHRPQQIEFARLNLNYTVMSKRKLLKLVEEHYVDGWDDPRMPTISGLRRRGYTPEAIRAFCEIIGIAKFDSTVDMALLEHCLRDDLNRRAQRVMAVLRPLKIVITNYPEGSFEELECVNNPEDPEAGFRYVPFARELYIEQEDFMEEPPKKFFRLAPGREVRLRYAYYITCQEVVKDADGNITELRCTYDPETKGGQSADNRKVKATLHWVSCQHAVPATVRLYDRLFVKENPDKTEDGKEFTDYLNPDSVEILEECQLEPSLKTATHFENFQFERLGYFCVDTDSSMESLVFNRAVSLRDQWVKEQQRK